uniref:LysR family transcriptional regulator n=2 Tax=cellular organisms TaxID=131567 RepID=A0A1I7YAS6_9BILA
MLALAQAPQRWLALVTPSMLDTLQCPPGHPLAKVHTLLLNLLQEQGNLDGLL